MGISAECANWATGRDLRRIGRRANFYRVEIVDFEIESEEIPKTDEGENTKKEIRSGPDHMPGFRDFLRGSIDRE